MTQPLGGRSLLFPGGSTRSKVFFLMISLGLLNAVTPLKLQLSRSHTDAVITPKGESGLFTCEFLRQRRSEQTARPPASRGRGGRGGRRRHVRREQTGEAASTPPGPHSVSSAKTDKDRLLSPECYFSFITFFPSELYLKRFWFTPNLVL
ncbi:hypothetical protein OJAV_G00164840 [Oryzias javanicus]|uniref:Uncharacterized protein n=1 Tax=Oryzias javanicus TaxID=123683 RepID=A0A437CK96_ORYJA|nr:hypothetical protein OJAV_G00164840 [Oryzias javanicus]